MAGVVGLELRARLALPVDASFDPIHIFGTRVNRPNWPIRW